MMSHYNNVDQVCWPAGYVIYPPLESLAEAEPRLNFPTEDKSYNLQVGIVDLVSTAVITSKLM